MSVTKKNLSKEVSNSLKMHMSDSEKIVNSFIKIIKTETQNKTVKIKNFGTFDYKISPQRYGRNPKTKESYIILRRKSIRFKVSNKIKGILN